VLPLHGQLFSRPNSPQLLVVFWHTQPLDGAALAAAARLQVKQQQEFVGWWGGDEGPGSNWGGDGHKNGERRSCSASQAKDLTGISQQQVSDWSNRLKDIDKYLAKIELVARRKADWEPNDNFVALGTGNNECSRAAQKERRSAGSFPEDH